MNGIRDRSTKVQGEVHVYDFQDVYKQLSYTTVQIIFVMFHLWWKLRFFSYWKLSSDLRPLFYNGITNILLWAVV